MCLPAITTTIVILMRNQSKKISATSVPLTIFLPVGPPEQMPLHNSGGRTHRRYFIRPHYTGITEFLAQ